MLPRLLLAALVLLFAETAAAADPASFSDCASKPPASPERFTCISQVANLKRAQAASAGIHPASGSPDTTCVSTTEPNSPDRIACVDKVFAPLREQAAQIGKMGEQIAKSTSGAWFNQTSKDAITDFEISVWIADNWIPGLDVKKPQLTARCRDHNTELLVDWGRYITTGNTGGRTPVTYRIDDKPAVTGTWQMSSNFEATFAHGPIALLRSMKGASQLIVSTVPFGGNEIRATFRISGADGVIEDLAKRCGWTP
jgi:hypothetical protein